VQNRFPLESKTFITDLARLASDAKLVLKPRRTPDLRRNRRRGVRSKCRHGRDHEETAGTRKQHRKKRGVGESSAASPVNHATDPVMHVAVSDASLATHRPNEEIVPGIKETGEVDMEVGHGRRFVLPIDGLRVYRLPPTAEWGAPAVTCSEPGVSMA
jgi:hypothetical protein